MSGKSHSPNTGVPVKLLYEAEGMKITIECKQGDIYRGLLVTVEGDTMNLQLTDVIQTSRIGQVRKLPTSSLLYIKGTNIRFIALPDLLKQSPLFQKVSTQKRKLEQQMAAKQGESAGHHKNKKRKL